MAKIEFPPKLEFLFQPQRYKVAFGGRAGCKSWGFARALLLIGANPGLLWPGRTTPLRILCARETMQSIKDSVHHLLSDQISKMGLGKFYEIEKQRIKGANGTEFFFSGIRYDVDQIKSYEAIDICWVEEAHNVSKSSWEVLIPTIRSEGSEIWVSFNPELETDDTFQRFVVNPPPNAKVVKITWRDNPWMPQVLFEEMEYLRARDPDECAHVWEGTCVNTLKSAIYAAELRDADANQRITRVPYDPTRPVDCFWDLGYGDATALWCVQAFPFEYHVIDYIEASSKTINWYLGELQNRGYIYGWDYLPWDIGRHAKLMGGGRSVEELMRAAGRKVKITPELSVAEGINAARTLFPLCWFDRERCADGLQALRHYRYGEVSTTGASTREPIHDENSHGSDAFRYFALGVKPPRKSGKKEQKQRYTVTAWS